MKQRNHAFDFLCGICIIRMVTLHITNACSLNESEWWQAVMHWTYFFMSFFFFKAGYFNKTTSGNSREFCIKKTRQLIIPYLTWGLIGNAIYFTFAAFFLSPDNAMVQLLNVKHLWMSGQFYGNVPCWFLLSFYVSYLVVHFMSKAKISFIIIIFPVISYWLFKHGNPLWFGLDNVFVGIFLFYLGRLWHKAMDLMNRNTTIILSTLMVAGFVALNYLFDGKYTMSANHWRGDFPIILAVLILGLCGISGLLITLRLPRIPVVNYIGEHSMVFFVAHYPILLLYKLIRTANGHTLRHHWDDYYILMLTVFAICFFLVPYVEKVPLLSGRFNKQK